MASGDPVVETRQGRLRGREKNGIRSFRGIRFARPPRAGLRFRPPQPPESWAGTREASRAGPAAPQLRVPGMSLISPGGQRADEDCLSLNVFTPGTDGAHRPVLVWIHGGGFLMGSGASPLYEGHSLARRGDLVVVTVNYRLGALGFLDLSSVFGTELKESSNLGLRDQIAALEWVRDNIERFGGDPGAVTILGQSAGAMCVASLLAAPSARGLFQRAIAMSGAADHVLPRESAAAVARALLAELGSPRPDPEVLGAIPVERILAAQRRTLRKLRDPRRLMIFLPSVDDDVLPRQPLDALRGRGGARVPLLLGTTLDEWRLFRLADPNRLVLRDGVLLERFDRVLASYPGAPASHVALGEYRAALRARDVRTDAREVWNAFQSARIFHHPAVRLAEAHGTRRRDTFMYLFTWRSPALRRTLGACHALDLPFVFGLTQHPLAFPLLGLDRTAPRLSRQMQQAWASFARDGVPAAPRLPDWPVYEPRQRQTMVLGRTTALDRAPLEAERLLWERWS